MSVFAGSLSFYNREPPMEEMLEEVSPESMNLS
jgi:hypothetical protein